MTTMKQLHFSVRIEAPVERVWQTMIGSESYKAWASVFAEGSYFEGSWEQGAQIRFLTPPGDGMVATIAESRRHEFISIKHVGMTAAGVDDYDSDEVKAWAPVFENYTFTAIADGTDVAVDLDVTGDFEDYMLETWPKALQTLKAMCEHPQ